MSLPRLKSSQSAIDDQESQEALAHLMSNRGENQEELERLMSKYNSNPDYEYDIAEYEKYKTHLEEFLFYRKKFE